MGFLRWWRDNIKCGCWVSPDGLRSGACREHERVALTQAHDAAEVFKLGRIYDVNEWFELTYARQVR
jgi:hypothetical protein